MNVNEFLEALDTYEAADHVLEERIAAEDIAREAASDALMLFYMMHTRTVVARQQYEEARRRCAVFFEENV